MFIQINQRRTISYLSASTMEDAMRESIFQIIFLHTRVFLSIEYSSPGIHLANRVSQDKTLGIHDINKVLWHTGRKKQANQEEQGMKINVSRYLGRERFTLECEVVTPMFLGMLSKMLNYGSPVQGTVTILVTKFS